MAVPNNAVMRASQVIAVVPQQQLQGDRNQTLNKCDLNPRPDDYDEQDTSDEECTDQEGGDILANECLYQGAPISVSESMALILNVKLKHNVPDACVKDIMEMLKCICPDSASNQISYNKFCKFTESSRVSMNKQFYCSVCFTALEGQSEQCKVCRVDTEKAYFVQLPLIPQLRELYKRQSFFNSLQHRHARVRQAGPKYLNDIYDGSVYQNSVKSGFLSNRFNISLTWHTDGVPLLQSKNYSIWPFLYMINELPYKMRTSRENFLLGGLWFGPQKPVANMFLRSFQADLKDLYNGVRISIADLGGKQAEVKAIVLASVCNMPVKSLFFNMDDNDLHGCTVCEIRGETCMQLAANQPNKPKHSYPYVEIVTLRSIDQYQERAKRALGAPNPVVGVSGPTALFLCMPDFYKGSAIDPLHLLTSVTKEMLELHFGEKCAGERFTIRGGVAVATGELLKIKPPKFIHSKSQSLEKYHQWNASQLITWLFYYSTPIYQNLMNVNYFSHFLKFVAAISLLNADMVTGLMIQKAERLLKEFVKDFQDLYNISFCSINIHLLLHLPDCVRRLGPLWVYSSAPLEKCTRSMAKKLRGKDSIDSQICKSFWNVLCKHRFLHEIPPGGPKEYITNHSQSVRIEEQIAPGCFRVGKYSQTDVSDQNIVRALMEAQFNAGNVSMYFRLFKDKMMYVAERYAHDLTSKSSYVMYDYRGMIRYGSVQVFFNAQCNCGEHLCPNVTGHFAIIREVKLVDNFQIPHHPDCSLTHIFRCGNTELLHVVPVSQLMTVCVHMNVFDKMFIAFPLNSQEKE